MSMKLLFLFMISLLATLSGCSPGSDTADTETKAPMIQFSDEIHSALDEDRRLLHAELDDPIYVNRLLSENETLTSPLTKDSIRRLDEAWIKPQSSLANQLLTSDCSRKLRFFQEQHPEFAEIFITDIHGRNVCLTNKTSDYYQADESWWIQTHTTQDPNGLNGPIEYDESASSESISIYLSVLNPQNSNKIGILKAVLKLDLIAERL